MSRATSPFDIDDTAFEASRAPSASTTSAVVDPFSRMMAPARVTSSPPPPTSFAIKDKCRRPQRKYNENYDPFRPARDDLKADYSPYSNGEPLFDDRPVLIANIPKGMVLSPTTKMLNRSWLWKLGYTFIQPGGNKKHSFWACKGCHHDLQFSKHKTYIFNSNSLKNAERHLLKEHYLGKDGDIKRLPSTALEPAQPSGFVDDNYDNIIPFRHLEFRNALTKWVVMDDITQRKATSKHLRRLFKIANNQAVGALPTAHSTIESWTSKMFAHFEPSIITEVTEAQSKISVSFDGWGSKREKISVVAIVLHFTNKRGQLITVLAGLPELRGHSKTGVDQAAVLLPLFHRFGINEHNLGWFVLDNATNNDTTLAELGKHFKFDPKTRRLRCMGHILNLIAEQYLFGQDTTSFEDDYKKAGAPARRQLWRQRGELGKLHNLVAHIMASGKRGDVFFALQTDLNHGRAANKQWKVVLDGGIRWNSSFQMIERALALREALDTYALKLRVSTDPLDIEVYDKDYLTSDEWKTLELMRDHLEPLFRLTKDLEGNPDSDKPELSSHGALWELLPIFEGLLSHFEVLEAQAKAGRFNNHRGIQESITLAWGKTQEYYTKTDVSIAWMAALVLHPRWKWQYFDEQWTGDNAKYVKVGRLALRKLWENDYKGEVIVRVEEKTPEPEPRRAYKAEMLEKLAPSIAGPSTLKAPRTSSRKDQLALYLEEPLTDMPLLEYWKMKQAQWPQLAKMALDFLSIPAMSSECERVFSSCSMQTTPHNSRLSGETLWHGECLKNWQRRGLIEIMLAYNAVQLGREF